MGQESYQYLNRLRRDSGYATTAPFVLFGFRKNRAPYSSRSSLIHSYDYEPAGDGTDSLARFRLRSEPFVKYPG
jgi:hypothetical protein